MKNFIDRILDKQPYLIAEIGVNHNGDIDLAKEMIEAAKVAGAKCVKFQNFIASRYISKKAQRAKYQDRMGEKSQHDIVQEYEINREQTSQLMNHAHKTDIDFLSTPFENWSLRTLLDLNVPAIKISSCNLTNYPFLEEAAKSNIPILLSTGMSDLNEVITAVDIFKKSSSPLIILQCTSNYPSKVENANLNVIPMFRKLFGVPIGFSDHTQSSTAAIASVALGAVVIEKHFTLSRKLPGVDQQASIEPQELRDLAIALQECSDALGISEKIISEEEIDTHQALRRSLVAKRDLKSGEILTKDMVAIKRPGNGLKTDMLPKLLGQTILRSVKEDELISLDDFAEI